MKDQQLSYASNPKSNERVETAQTYSVKCINQSAESMYFYFYQRTANQTSMIASLVWSASVYKVPQNGSFTFSWQETYAYFWQGYGAVQPTVVFDAEGTVPGTPETTVIFSIEDNTPVFGDVTQADISGMEVTTKFNVPDNTFGVGIGMSAVAAFLVQAVANGVQEFDVEPIYRIACSDNIETGMILSESSPDPSAAFSFPANIYSITITFMDGKFSMNGIEL